MVIKIDKRSKKVVLSLGGNIGNVKQCFIDSITSLEERVGNLSLTSSLYLTKAWGIENQRNFLNQVIVLETNLNPHEVLRICLEIEKEQGRKRVEGEKWQERPIDIDVLFYENEIINTNDLKLPHPHLHVRNFVLFPLAEIIPDFVHPALKKTVLRLKNLSDDNLLATRIID